MKTIEVTDEMYDALMVISKELNTQSHRCTAMPYVIQVSTKEEVAAYEGSGESYWFDDEGGRMDAEDEEKFIKDHLYEKHGDKFNDVYDDMGEYEMEEILENNNCRKLEVTERTKLTDFFFTDKGLRSYYGEDVNTYMTGTRSPELKTVMTFLCELSGGKLHR